MGGNAFAPIFLANPVADFGQSKHGELGDVPSDLSIIKDGLVDGGLVAHDFRPVDVEGITIRRVAGGEGRHVVGFGVELMGVENREVGGDDVAQGDVWCNVGHRMASELGY